MKKKLSLFCSAIAVVALLTTVLSVKMPQAEIKNNITNAALEQHYDDADDMNTTMDAPTEEPSSSGSSGGLGDILGGIGGGSGDFGSSFIDGIGGLGGIFGDAGDILGGLGGTGSGNSSNGVLNTTVGGNDAIYIDPVPAATQTMTQGETIVQPAPNTQAPQSTVPVAETLNPNAITNPYARPTGEIKPGDMGDGVKWIQWNIIYSGYGLQGKEISGVYDDETVEAVKKLQAENGLTADGVVNDAVIDKIEHLYFQYITSIGQATTAPVTSVNTTAVATVGGNQNDDGSNILIIILAVILIAFIWIIAIIVIVIVLIVKKKKKKKLQEKAPEGEAKPETEVKEEPEKKNDGMSLSDLFEEANNKKK